MISKLMFVLLAAFTVFLNLSADQGQLAQSHDEAEDFRMAPRVWSQRQKPTIPQKTKRPRSNFKAGLRARGELCRQDCRFFICTDHRCPRNHKCCRLGGVSLKGMGCCPRNKPRCLGRRRCCPIHYSKLCGNWCCRNGARCCYIKKKVHCCFGGK